MALQLRSPSYGPLHSRTHRAVEVFRNPNSQPTVPRGGAWSEEEGSAFPPPKGGSQAVSFLLPTQKGPGGLSQGCVRAPHSPRKGPCWLYPGLARLVFWSYFPFGSGGSPEPRPPPAGTPSPRALRALCPPSRSPKPRTTSAARPCRSLTSSAEMVQPQERTSRRSWSDCSWNFSTVPAPEGSAPKVERLTDTIAAWRAFSPGGTKALLSDPSAPKRGCDPPRLLPRPGIRQGPLQPKKGGPRDWEGGARQGRSGVSARNYALGTKGRAWVSNSQLPPRLPGFGPRV